MIKTCAIWCNRLVQTLIVTALLLVAVYVSIGRYYIGYVETYQQQLVDRVSTATGLSMKVGKLYGRWSKLAPVLTMENLSIYVSEAHSESVLSIDSLSFKLAPLQSLLRRSLQVQQLYINGVKCSLQEVELGRWQLKGYPSDYSGGGDINKLMDLLLTVRGAELMDARLELDFANGSNALLAVEELSLNHDEGFRRLRLRARFDESDKPLLAIIEAQGDPRKQQDFSARAYLQLDDVDFSAQLPMLKVFGVDLRDAQIDGEIWMDWLPDSLLTVQGKLATPLLDIAAISGEQLQPLKNVSVSFRAEKTSQYDWQGWIPQLSASWQQQDFQLQQLQLELGKNQLSLALPELDISALSQQLLAVDLHNDKLSETLSTLALKGRLTNVWLTLFSQPEDGEAINDNRFVLSANAHQLAVSPWHAAPGATGVSGYLEVAPTWGKVMLDGEQFSLQLPKVYEQPLAFDSVLGQLQWQLADERLLLQSGPIKLTADHGPASVLLNLDIPLKAGAEPAAAMTLAVGLTDTAASYRDKFIPYLLNEDFLRWMKSSVPSGHVKQGGFLYRGSLRAGDVDHRTVQLYLDVDHTTLDYHADWPALTDISGLVEVDDNRVKVKTREAKMFELKVPAALVEVVPLDEGGMWLTVAANALGNAGDGLRVVNESAIQKLVGGVFSQWQLNGEVSADVQLGIPLAGAEQSAEIAVSVDLDKADLTIPEYKLDFTALAGQLNYSSVSGISSAGLAGQFYQKPLTVAVSQGRDKAVQVAINGRLDMRDVEQWSQQAALGFTAGETDFSADLHIAAEGSSKLTMQSNLLGVSIDLPTPFHKEAERAQPFWLELPISKDQSLLTMGFSKLAGLQLMLKQGTVESGLVIIGSATNTAHQADYLTVTGQLNEFDWQQWQPVLERYSQYQQLLLDAQPPVIEPETAPETFPHPADSDEPLPATMTADSTQQTAMQVKVRDVQLKTFIGFGQQFENSLVSLQRESDSWLIDVSNQLFEGGIKLPDQQQLPIKVNLQRLQLPDQSAEESAGESGDEQSVVASAEESAEPDAQAADASTVDPFAELLLDFSVAQLSIGDKPLGSLAFELRSQPEAALFNNIHGDIRGIIMAEDKPLTLEWRRTAAGDSSRLFGEFNFADLGRVLEQWNYQRVISSTKGAATLDLSWPGGPDQWQLQSSSGSLQLQIRDGRFLKASDTATGTLKVVGIVNFMNIARRLQLDFSDLYKSGISFDEIEGQVLLADQQLKIVDDLKVTSPSSRFYLRGDADLLAKQLDMELIATLPVANNLPWIVALAGGLPTAAGVYVASKIFENQVDRFSSAIYSVSGDWNNPDMQFDRLFDDGKKSKSSKSSAPAATPTAAETAVDEQPAAPQATEPATLPSTQQATLPSPQQAPAVANEQPVITAEEPVPPDSEQRNGQSNEQNSGEQL
jgi:uncharacterized protein (TIGR02099 family)